jgi:hypothetical protein
VQLHPYQLQGVFFLGFIISSEGTVTNSNPTYAQNISTIALPRPLNPKGTIGVKLAKSNEGFIRKYIILAKVKISIGAILTIVKISLFLAACLTPK